MTNEKKAVNPEIKVYTIPVPANTLMIVLNKLFAKHLPKDCDLELTDVEADHKVGRLITKFHILAVPKAPVKAEPEPEPESESAPSEVHEVVASESEVKTQ